MTNWVVAHITVVSLLFQLGYVAVSWYVISRLHGIIRAQRATINMQSEAVRKSNVIIEAMLGNGRTVQILDGRTKSNGRNVH